MTITRMRNPGTRSRLCQPPAVYQRLREGWDDYIFRHEALKGIIVIDHVNTLPAESLKT